MKYQVNWNTVGDALQDLPWRSIWSDDNPVEVLNEHLSLLVGRYVPTKAISVRNKDKLWFDEQCRRAFDLKQKAYLSVPVIALGLIGKSLSTVKLELMKPTRRRDFCLVSEAGIC